MKILQIFKITVIIWKKLMNLRKTNECNLREDETLAEVVKNTNVCIIKVFPDTKKESGVKMLGKLLRKWLVLKKVVIVNF